MKIIKEILGMEQKNIIPETKTCPLLKQPYIPDSIDLTKNSDERQYWLSCLKDMVHKFVDKSAEFYPQDPTATQRAKAASKEFQAVIERLQNDHSIFSPLSIRTLLEFNEKTLRKHSFNDAWCVQKRNENIAALKQFKSRIENLDKIIDKRTKLEELCKGIVAGNMFDWGAKAVTDILESNDGFSLNHALSKIEKRPWLQDDVDLWIHRLESDPYKCVTIFVDNSGVDLILGVLPLVRELLSQGSQVILSANSEPSLNDVTHDELPVILNDVSKDCEIIKQALKKGQLMCCANGQEGPCLDLNNLNPELCRAMLESDLVILEGMGRAIHTNLYAKLTVDCVKLAVIKNEWLAKRLGGYKFSVIFKYAPAKC